MCATTAPKLEEQSRTATANHGQPLAKLATDRLMADRLKLGLGHGLGQAYPWPWPWPLPLAMALARGLGFGSWPFFRPENLKPNFIHKS